MGTDSSAGAGCGVSASRPALTLEKMQWSDVAEAALSLTLGDAWERDVIRAGVESGRLELWRWNGGQAWMVTRAQGDTLTVHCFQGSGIAQIVEPVKRIAAKNGLRWVEYWTESPALVRMTRRWGFRPFMTAVRARSQE